MTKKWLFGFIIVAIFFTGYSTRIPLENGALILLIGVDKGANKNLIVGTSTTVFKGKSKKNTFEEVVEAPSVYSAFSKINTKTTGYLTSSKAQILLIGKEFTKQPNWPNKLDAIVRDPSSTSNIKLIQVDGQIRDFFSIKPPNNLSISMYLQDIIQASLYDNMIVPSDIQEVLRQKNEEGMTQTIPIIKKENNAVQTKGIAFFDQSSRYVTSLPSKDVPIYSLLKKEKLQGRMILNIILNDSASDKSRIVSVLIEKANRQIDVGFKNDKFQFDIKLDIALSIIEGVNGPTITSNDDQGKIISLLERQITKSIDKELNKVIKKIQSNKIDPIGLSMYARANQYQQWKLHKKNWGNKISNSNIKIKTLIKIGNTGIIRG